MADFEDGYWSSRDGLRLHYRDYGGDPLRPAILCLPGLTRNARDFEPLAARLAGDWRLVCPDLRGRALSEYAKDPQTYTPLTYLEDLTELVAKLRLRNFVIIGTSLGGMLAMLMAGMPAFAVVGVVLNDVGPKLDPAGLTRIRGYVGKSGAWPTWAHAARAIADVNHVAFPDYSLPDWLAMAKRLCRLTQGGRIVFDYDLKIAEPFRVPSAEAAPEMWGAFTALNTIPTLAIRGELSDLLSKETLEKMKADHPKLQTTTIPRVGHAPVLDEPMAVASIDAFLSNFC